MIKILFLTIFIGISSFSNEIPTYSSLVDESKTLSQSQFDELQRLINSNNNENLNLAVLITNSLGNEPIEKYTESVAKKWQIGSSGVLIVVAISDKKFRIVSSKKLEATYSSEKLRHIQYEMKPYFKRNNFFEGIKKGVFLIQEKPEPQSQTPVDVSLKKKKEDFSFYNVLWFIFIVVGLLFLINIPFKLKEKERTIKEISQNEKELELQKKLLNEEIEKQKKYENSPMKTYYQEHLKLKKLEEEYKRVENELNFLKKFDEVQNGK